MDKYKLLAAGLVKRSVQQFTTDRIFITRRKGKNFSIFAPRHSWPQQKTGIIKKERQTGA